MKSKNLTVIINQKIKPFKKQITVDSDKSLSIRSFLIGSICQGVSNVDNVLESDDVMSAVAVCKNLELKLKRLSRNLIKFLEMG